MYTISTVLILLAVYGSGYYQAKRTYEKWVDNAELQAYKWERLYNTLNSEIEFHVGSHQIPEDSELNSNHSPIPENWNDRMSDEEFYNEFYKQ